MRHNQVVAESAPELPVSPDANEHLCPNVQASGSSEGAQRTESEAGVKRQRVRLDRDTEVEVVTGEGAPEGEDAQAPAPEDAHAPAPEEDAPERAQGERVRRVPHGPSAEEMRVHRATHCPYRSWCPKCVAGRGHQGPHTKSEDPLDDTPIVSIDYCFMRRSSDDTTVPVLIAMVRKIGLVFAHVVPHKGGSHKEVVAQLAKDLSRCGFNGKVILKGDQENAIEDLIREVARHRGTWKLCWSSVLFRIPVGTNLQKRVFRLWNR